MRQRKIQKYGHSYAIKLEPADMKDFGLVEGDIIDIDDLNLLKQENKKKTFK